MHPPLQALYLELLVQDSPPGKRQWIPRAYFETPELVPDVFGADPVPFGPTAQNY